MIYQECRATSQYQQQLRLSTASPLLPQPVPTTFMYSVSTLGKLLEPNSSSRDVSSSTRRSRLQCSARGSVAVLALGSSICRACSVGACIKVQLIVDARQLKWGHWMSTQPWTQLQGCHSAPHRTAHAPYGLGGPYQATVSPLCSPVLQPQLPRDSKVDLPLWLARPLQERNIASVGMPGAYNER